MMFMDKKELIRYCHGQMEYLLNYDYHMEDYII